MSRVATFWEEKEEIWKKKKGKIKEDESEWWEEDERLIK